MTKKEEPFKAKFENRLYELNFDAWAYRQIIVNYFENTIPDEVQSEIGGQGIWHIDYGGVREMPHWIYLAEVFERMMKDAGSCLDFNEFKHTLKFSFIEMAPHSELKPHTASFVRAMSSVNIPLQGKTVIDLYEDHPHDPFIAANRKLESHQYFNPILLNVNQFHGVRNQSNERRLVLKVHLPIVSYRRLVASFEFDGLFPIFEGKFDEGMPWSNKRGTKQKI